MGVGTKDRRHPAIQIPGKRQLFAGSLRMDIYQSKVVPPGSL